MPATYESLATNTLSSAASSITFSSISGSYTDLRLVFVPKSTAGDNIAIKFNSDSGSNYSSTWVYGDGSSATSSRNTAFSRIQLPISLSSSQFSVIVIDILSYTDSKNKTVLIDYALDASGSSYVTRQISLWRNTGAITSILLESQGGGTFTSGTTATLYGILKA
jgi:hypothetical protein